MRTRARAVALARRAAAAPPARPARSGTPAPAWCARRRRARRTSRWCARAGRRSRRCAADCARRTAARASRIAGGRSAVGAGTVCSPQPARPLTSASSEAADQRRHCSQLISAPMLSLRAIDGPASPVGSARAASRSARSVRASRRPPASRWRTPARSATTGQRAAARRSHGQRRQHGDDEQQLPDLDADVEGEQRQHQLIGRQPDLPSAPPRSRGRAAGRRRTRPPTDSAVVNVGERPAARVSSSATSTMLSAISASTGAGGTCTTPSTASASARLCATREGADRLDQQPHDSTSSSSPSTNSR